MILPQSEALRLETEEDTVWISCVNNSVCRQVSLPPCVSSLGGQYPLESDDIEKPRLSASKAIPLSVLEY